MKKTIVFVVVLLAVSCTTRRSLKEQYTLRTDCEQDLTDFTLVDYRGRVRAHGRLKNGKYDGKIYFYYSNGDSIGNIEYSEGVRDGKVLLYYSKLVSKTRDYVKKMEYYFEDGKLEGKQYGYYPSGARRSVYTYKNDSLISAELYENNREGSRVSGAPIQAARDRIADNRFFRALDMLADSAGEECIQSE